MKLFTKDGKTLPLSRIILKNDDFQVINPTEEMVLADGWVEYIIPELTDEQKLARAKEDKKREIADYDQSTNVNEFYMLGFPVWLDKATRAGLKLRFEAELESGRTETSLWYGNMQFPLQLENAMKMLFAIELYASACYDNTQRHLAEIEKLETIDELAAYDYTAGYPEKLNF